MRIPCLPIIRLLGLGLLLGFIAAPPIASEGTGLSQAGLRKLAESHVARFAGPIAAARGDEKRLITELDAVRDLAVAWGFTGPEVEAIESLCSEIFAGSYSPKADPLASKVEIKEPGVEKPLPVSTIVVTPAKVTAEDEAKLEIIGLEAQPSRLADPKPLPLSADVTYPPEAAPDVAAIHPEDNGANGPCDYADLTSGVIETTTGDSRNYRYEQTQIYWTAIGIRPTGPEQWTVRMREDPAPYPECLTGHGSEGGGFGQVSCVILDYNHIPPSTGYIKTYRQFPGVNPGTVEWDDGADILQINGPRAYRSTGPADVLEVWDVFLTAGTTYTFEFERFGAADTKLLLERNPFNGGLYTIRGYDFEEFETISTRTYTAPASDWYGVIVVNDNGQSGSYTLRVGTCTSPLPLTSGVSTFTPASLGYYTINQQSIYWTAVGVRDPGSDWDIDAYTAGGGGVWPVCFNNNQAASTGIGLVDFVIGDFNSGQNPLGTYFIRSYQYSGTSDARTEWDDGTDQLAVGAPLTARNTGAADVLEVWDVFLTGGTDYDFVFQRSGAADTKLLLYRSFGGVYWGNRFTAVFETTNPHTIYTAPVSDWYGVVVVNDNGADGQYSVGVGLPSLSVNDGGLESPPRLTKLHPVAPNPAHGEVTFGFDLGSSGTVALEVLDVTGRRVAELPAQARAAGTWEVPWGGTDRGLPSGHYWVRMAVDAREVDRQRFVLLR